MTEQDLQEIRKMTDRWYQDDEISFRQSSVYDILLDEVEWLHREKAIAVGMINKDQEEIRRLQKALENILDNFDRPAVVSEIARKALEGRRNE